MTTLNVLTQDEINAKIQQRGDELKANLLELAKNQPDLTKEKQDKIYNDFIATYTTNLNAENQQRIDAPARLAAEVAARVANEYKAKRAAEYPDFRIYLDGVVKGDQEQIQGYIDACNAVKAKYPKP